MSLTAKRNLSALLFAIFAAVQLLASVPALHAFVHEDANSPTHECAVTFLLHGQVDASAAVVAVVPAPPPIIVDESFSEASLISQDTPLRPGRGPPLLS